MTLLHLNPCYNKMQYKGTVLYKNTKLKVNFIISTKTCVVCTQKNHLNEMALLNPNKMI